MGLVLSAKCWLPSSFYLLLVTSHCLQTVVRYILFRVDNTNVPEGCSGRSSAITEIRTVQLPLSGVFLTPLSLHCSSVFYLYSLKDSHRSPTFTQVTRQKQGPPPLGAPPTTLVLSVCLSGSTVPCAHLSSFTRLGVQGWILNSESNCWPHGRAFQQRQQIFMGRIRACSALC